MTTHTTYTTTHNPVRSDLAAVPAARTSRRWALAGLAAGVAGVGTMVTAGMVNAVYDESLFGDTPGVADKLADQTGPMFAFHSITVLGVVLMIVFAAGLFRRLRAAAGPDALAPLVVLRVCHAHPSGPDDRAPTPRAHTPGGAPSERLLRSNERRT